ncbi:hypothetical protein IR151_17595 [Clostridioides sp. ES-S-0006-03]|uniref:hypothetical protein n=1 Tax=Clostridioides sp. ES-S-0006-03 TaxID=2770775 RepID=UPI001D0CB43D|nr:hypothetical protein [Clostridioides sp. ES-S-0006-03]
MAKVNKENVKEEEKSTVNKENVKTKNKSVIRKELKSNAKNIEVEVMNITNGSVFYKCKRTNEIIELDEPGDTTTVSLDLLLNMKTQSKSMLDGLILSIVDVFDGIDMDSVLDVLGLEDKYKVCDMKLDSIDDFIENSTNEKFEKSLDKINEKVLKRIIERAIKLSKQGKLDSNYKRILLEEKSHSKYLFSSI